MDDEAHRIIIAVLVGTGMGMILWAAVLMVAVYLRG